MRRPDPPLALADLLFEDPQRFAFFQAVRLLEQVGRDRGLGPVGHDVLPADEAVRFVSLLALQFPASEIADLAHSPGASPDARSGPPRMSVAFMGLIGPAGALPMVYTEDLINPDLISTGSIPAKVKRKTAPAVDFFDLFQHRMVSLFYRAWEKYNALALHERGGPGGTGRDGRDAFTARLFDLVGLGLKSLRGRQAVSDRALPFYAGFFAQQHRSAVALELLIRDHFGRPAEVESFVGRWLHLREDQQSRMGAKRGAFGRLGSEAMAGRKSWDEQGKFRVRLGPLGLGEFLDFLPGGRLVDELTDLIRYFVRGELDFDIQLVLRAEEVPDCRPSRDPRASPRLGRTAWLKSREFSEDADDAIVRPGVGRVGPRSGPVGGVI